MARKKHSVILPSYTSKYIKPGRAVQVWFIDRFNQGEWEDFKKDELVDSQQNHTAYISLEMAKKDLIQDIENEIEENKEYEEQPDLLEQPWKPEWETSKLEGYTHITLDAPDGSVYTIRCVPLYIKN